MHRRVGQLHAIANSSKVTVNLRQASKNICSTLIFWLYSNTPTFLVGYHFLCLLRELPLFQRLLSVSEPVWLVYIARLGNSPLAMLLGNCADSYHSFLFHLYKEIGLRQITLLGCCWDWCQKGVHGTEAWHSIIKVVLSIRNFTHFWCQRLLLPEMMLHDLKDRRKKSACSAIYRKDISHQGMTARERFAPEWLNRKRHHQITDLFPHRWAYRDLY